jgi:hypothetical protein
MSKISTSGGWPKGITDVSNGLRYAILLPKDHKHTISRNNAKNQSFPPIKKTPLLQTRFLVYRKTRQDPWKLNVYVNSEL